jgi:hypothetical protein
MTTITSSAKHKLEHDILAEFPEFAKKIGLNGYSYMKLNEDKDMFHMNDKDKTYLFTPSYKLDEGFGDFDAGHPVEFKMVATLFKDDTLKINNIDFEFHDNDDHLLKQLVHLHDLTNYLANFKELSSFILARSDIVEHLAPTLKFNFEGVLIELGGVFKYSESYLHGPSSARSSNRYYTNSLSLYNEDYNRFYKITNPQEALIFAKMSFLSIHDENIQELFDTEDWEDLYNKFKDNPEAFLSLYDMTKI